jgi:hypothetical protein
MARSSTLDFRFMATAAWRGALSGFLVAAVVITASLSVLSPAPAGIEADAFTAFLDRSHDADRADPGPSPAYAYASLR